MWISLLLCRSSWSFKVSSWKCFLICTFLNSLIVVTYIFALAADIISFCFWKIAEIEGTQFMRSLSVLCGIDCCSVLIFHDRTSWVEDSVTKYSSSFQLQGQGTLILNCVLRLEFLSSCWWEFCMWSMLFFFTWLAEWFSWFSHILSSKILWSFSLVQFFAFCLTRRRVGWTF